MSSLSLPPEIFVKVIHNLVAANIGRREWLPLRLVNRLFNRELVFAFFVLRVGTVQDACYVSYPEGRFQRLIASWSLSGALLRPMGHEEDYLKFLDTTRETVKRLDEWVRGHPSTLASEYSGTSALADNMAVFPKTTQVVCDALVCTISSLSISVSECLPLEKLQAAKYTVSQMFYLTACFVGNISAVQHALEHLEKEMTTDSKQESIRIGLMVAARQGNEDVARYLLDTGVDLNMPAPHGNDSIISAAPESGSVSLMRLFLRPEYRLDTSNEWYRFAVLNAAQIPDPTARREMVKIMWAQLKAPDKPQIRTEALWRACWVNDPELAEFILADGPANIYDQEHVGSEHPLVAAFEYQSYDIIHIILKAPFVDVPDERLLRLRQNRVLRSAILHNNLPIFLDIIVRQNWLKADDIPIKAAKVEYAVEAVNNMLGPYNFDVPYKHLDTTSTVGAHTLSVAAGALRTHNVAWLLARGIRTQKRIRVHVFLHRSCVDEFELMEDLLKSHHNPGFEFY